ncbi:MAG: hypothetical protein HQM11_14890 [SAR324 cluster bacterium]|nr:hypothetical protein [SAR324 cluster bacterium]
MSQDSFYPLMNRDVWFVQQVREWGEILTGFESRNKYEIIDEHGSALGFVVEESGGFMDTLLRLFLRSHRPFRALILDAQGTPVLQIIRPFFWIWSSLSILNMSGEPLGEVHRRFALLHRQYDLLNKELIPFARIWAGLFRIWTFDLKSLADETIGMIAKKWSGMFQEMFTNSDRYIISIDPSVALEPEEKAVVFATAISIDFDYFEKSSNS